MLFFNRKQKIDEILPPPPPDLDMELERELLQKPKFFDKIVEPEKMPTPPEEMEFSDLINDLEGKKPAGFSIKKDRILKKKDEKSKKAQSKEMKRWKTQIKNLEKQTIKPTIKNTNEGIESELTTKGEFMENSSKILEKPQEILEAEQEIRDAIEKIKIKEKPSFFRNLFAKREGTVIKDDSIEEPSIPEAISVDGISFIQNKINEIRQYLTTLDLENARTSYIEIMSCYSSMKPEEKAIVYNDVREIYLERKNAEGIKGNF